MFADGRILVNIDSVLGRIDQPFVIALNGQVTVKIGYIHNQHPGLMLSLIS